MTWPVSRQKVGSTSIIAGHQSGDLLLQDLKTRSPGPLRDVVRTVTIKTANFGLGPEPVTAYMLCGLLVDKACYSSPIAMKYQERMGKYGTRLFTFLDYDGAPWNNNNAEHAIKVFAGARRYADGRFTEDSIREYLVMLSVVETCRYQNIAVLEFLLGLANNSSAMQLSLE